MKRSNCYQFTRFGVLLLFVFMMALTVNAIPAKPGLTKTLQLTDGTMVQARLVGDEFGHYWISADGKTYVSDEATNLYKLADVESIKSNARAKRSRSNARRVSRMGQNKVGEIGSYTGKKKGLIILVNFKDVKFQTANNNALYQRIANEVNFNYKNFVGSMYDYFYAQSEGQFELTFDVVGPVTVSNNQSYYGSNDSQGNDKHPAAMVIEALKLVNGDVNFANYDWDGDGEVDQVYVVYAGKGEADGGAATTIWPHEWQLSAAGYYGDGSGAQTLDGVRIDTYACGAELDGTSGTIAGIGTMCHEFSHCLGYPDFYDTDYSGGQGMGNWDLMDGGSYNGDGYCPAGYTSYERWVAGWKEPLELTNSKSVTGMKALSDGGEAYIIYNNGNKNEYFLLENRQHEGWDAGIPGEGLLILHVDYNSSSWANNTPNDDPSHQRMTWIAADNKYQYTTYQGTKYFSFEGMINDPFPYGSVNAFNKSTTPAAKFYNKNSDGTYYMDSSVENITQNSDGTVSFNFKGVSNVSTPVFSPNTGVYTEAQNVTITCATKGAVIYYTIDGKTPTANSTRYTAPIPVESTTTIKAIAIADGEESDVASGTFVISTGSSSTNTYKRITSTSELVSGLRYVIGCGSKNVAAGSLSTSLFSTSGYLTRQSVTMSDDIMTINNNVSIYTLVETAEGYALMNDEGKYLYATAAKALSLSDDAQSWTLSENASGVIMTFGAYGTMLYNVSSPRFNTYTSNPTTSMIYANLYVEYVETPKEDVTLRFEATELTGKVGEDFQEPTLMIYPAGISVTYSSNNPAVATVDAAGNVTLVGAGEVTITASFEGNNEYNSATASYTISVTEEEKPDDPTPSVTSGKYQLVTSTDDLESGKKYLIVSTNSSGNVAYDGFETNKGKVGAVSPVDDVIDLNIETNSAVPVVLTKDASNYWNVFDTSVSAYIGHSTKTSKHLATLEQLDVTSNTYYAYAWTISIDNDNVASMKENNKDYYLKYNPSSNANMFRVYSKGQRDIYLYKEIEETILKGDVNGDGFVNVADVVAIVNYILGTPPEIFHFDAADMDSDGVINITDAVALVNYLLGVE